MMTSKTKILLISLIALAVFVFFNEYLVPYMEPVLGPVWSKILLYFIVFAIVSMDILADLVSNWIEGKRKRDLVKDYVNEIVSFFERYTSISLKTKISKETEVLRDDVYREVIATNFPVLDENQINSLILLVLVYHYSLKRRREFYDLIQFYVSILRISDLSREAKQFLVAYNRVRTSKERLNDVQVFFLEDKGVDYGELAKQFCQNFSKDAIFRFIREDLNQSEELRRTLIELVTTKEIPLMGVRKDVIKTLEEHLSRRKLYTRTYLLIGHKLGDKLKEYLRSSLPGIIGRGWSCNIPGKRSTIFSVYLIKADDIETIDKFYQRMKSLIGKDKECFMLVSSTDFVDSKIFVLPKDKKFSSGFVKDGFEIANYIKSGFYHIDVDIWSLITQSDISIDHLLSSIPFTVFVTNLSEKERTLLISSYMQIKRNFNIERLDDWKDLNDNKMAKYLSEIEYEGFRMPIERCLEISKTIKEKSRKFDKSLKPLNI